MRKFLIFLFIPVLILSFILFFNAGEKKKEEGKIHWNFLNAVPYAEPYYIEVLDLYMADHPEQSYEFTTLGWDEFFAKFSAAAAGEADIDIIWLDGSIVRNSIAVGALMDLTDLVGDTSVFRLDHPGYIYRFKDRLYGLALGPLELEAVYYNKDIFDKYGLEVPETYDDMLAVSKTLRQNGIGPFLKTGSPAFWWMALWSTLLAQFTDDPTTYIDDLVDGKRKFTDGAALEAFRWLKKLKDDGVFMDNIEGIDENTSYSLFVTGKAAMFFHGTWVVPIFTETAGGKDKLPRIGVTHFPYLTPERRFKAVGGFPLGIGIYTKIADHKLQPALDLVRYMTSKEVSKTITELDMSPMACRTDVTPEMDPITAEFAPLAEAVERWGVDWVCSEELKEVMWQNLHAIVAGIVSPEEAAQNIQEVADRNPK